VSESAIDQKLSVRTFWERDPCGSEHTAAPEGTAEFYAEVERMRAELDPQIPRFADFDGARGEEVLEIGVGLGSDFLRFVRAGARGTGVDLTQHAVELVRRRLDLEGLDADVLQADAEQLPFADASFDRIYSWGVLHHSPDTDRAVREAIRVLRPGGRLCVMLYARHSWVTYGMWVRHALLAGKPWRGLAAVLSGHMESPGTTAYTARELRSMFAGLDDVRVDQVSTSYDTQMVGPLARLTGDRLGWNLVVRGRRAA
jgi:ubiquinone/menaquinone biosynthesis C-methylase UbiE